MAREEIHGFANVNEPPLDPWQLMAQVEQWYAKCTEVEYTDVDDALQMIGELIRTMKHILVRPRFVQVSYGEGPDYRELYAVDDSGQVWEYAHSDSTEWTRPQGWHPLNMRRHEQ